MQSHVLLCKPSSCPDIMFKSLTANTQAYTKFKQQQISLTTETQLSDRFIYYMS